MKWLQVIVVHQPLAIALARTSSLLEQIERLLRIAPKHGRTGKGYEIPVVGGSERTRTIDHRLGLIGSAKDSHHPCAMTERPNVARIEFEMPLNGGCGTQQ